MFAFKRLLAVALLALLGSAVARSSDGPATLVRPDQIENWPSVGITVRMDQKEGSRPWQIRHVRIDPEAYQHFTQTRRLPDGAIFAVQISSTAFDGSQSPPLYRATGLPTLAVEVLDRTHPDGRRFYTFAEGQIRASALPPGNACAVCHNRQGDTEGVFARFYPGLQESAAAGSSRHSNEENPH